MTRKELMMFLEEEECLVADGLEAALIGYICCAGMATKALYDAEKCIAALAAQGMTEDEATEYYEFNVVAAYVGKTTPAFATLVD